MLSESDRNELRFLAIQHGFIGLGCEVRDIADRLLNAGVENEELIAIYLAEPDDRDSIIPAFECFLNSVKIAIPDRDTAVWGMLEHFITRIARQDGDPLDLMYHLMEDVYYEYEFQEQPCNYVGGSHGIDRLLGFYCGYDDLLNRPHEISCNGKLGTEAINELKGEIVKEANVWLEKYAGLH